MAQTEHSSHAVSVVFRLDEGKQRGQQEGTQRTPAEVGEKEGERKEGPCCPSMRESELVNDSVYISRR